MNNSNTYYERNKERIIAHAQIRYHPEGYKEKVSSIMKITKTVRTKTK